MGKSVEELLMEHNKIAREYNKVHKQDSIKGEKLKAEYQKIWKKILDLRIANKGTEEKTGGNE